MLTAPYLGEFNTIGAHESAHHPARLSNSIGLQSMCQSIIEAVTEIDDDLLRGCPTSTLVKALYALKALYLIQALGNAHHSTSSRAVRDHRMQILGLGDLLRGKLMLIAGSSREFRVPAMMLAVTDTITTQIRRLGGQAEGFMDTKWPFKNTGLYHAQRPNHHLENTTTNLIGSSDLSVPLLMPPLQNGQLAPLSSVASMGITEFGDMIPPKLDQMMNDHTNPWGLG